MEIHINVSNMCRICLIEENLIDILLLGEPTSSWMTDIHRYFGVQLTFHEEKSTKLCISCYRKIETWRKDVLNATKNQNVIEFLDATIKKQGQERRNRQNQ
ncbi:uncharacterized protein LOC111026765 [Myzus persicae]|uniref:uncharacterized protein LOC111026765 n=1 Tax=Myzus persicae TaxID=13164 RepID=UPI000B939DBB|nr:uncharacterized protein LOC111026765 [Myzus persicae]XP_022160591.1 uncharacterized protein LOC111026765 [Myzus persicae]XP_022160592.1 uncharacterized protein LOC111026765 [Myzus persicae]